MCVCVGVWLLCFISCHACAKCVWEISRQGGGGSSLINCVCSPWRARAHLLRLLHHSNPPPPRLHLISFSLALCAVYFCLLPFAELWRCFSSLRCTNRLPRGPLPDLTERPQNDRQQWINMPIEQIELSTMAAPRQRHHRDRLSRYRCERAAPAWTLRMGLTLISTPLCPRQWPHLLS